MNAPTSSRDPKFILIAIVIVVIFILITTRKPKVSPDDLEFPRVNQTQPTP